MSLAYYLFIMAALATLQLESTAQAEERHIISKNLNCRSFEAHFVTEVTILHDTASRAYSQSLKFVPGGTRSIFTANLDQHRSRWDGRKGLWLDGIASGASCFHSRFGQDYLIVDFACWNNEARTCHTAMDWPGSEWTQIYDSRARPLTDGQAGRDQRRLDALGLEFRLWQQLPNEVDLW